MLDKNKVLVLGGAGFIGSNLVRALVKDGKRPVIFTRPTYAVSMLSDILDNIDIIYGDFMDDVAIRKALNGVDTVYHLISTTFPNTTIESSVYDIFSNLIPTIRLVELCSENKVKRIIYASSGGTVYGEPEYLPIDEKHPLIPKSIYGQSKMTIENYLGFYARSMDIIINVLRISNPYGPGQNPFGAQGLVAVTLGKALHNRKITIYGDGNIVRDYVYIDDVIRAMTMAAKVDRSMLVNISSAKGYSILDIVNKIEQVTKIKLVKEFIPYRVGDVKTSILSNGLAKEIFNWSPAIDLDEGIQKTWEWIKQIEK